MTDHPAETEQGERLARLPAEERWTLLEANLHSKRWREPLRLCAARLSASVGRTAEAEALVARILEAGSPYEAQLHRDLLLAADCAADATGVGQPLLQRIAEALWPLLGARTPALAKAALQQLFRLWQLREDGRPQLPELELRLVEWLLKKAASLSSVSYKEDTLEYSAWELLKQAVRNSSPAVQTFLCARIADPKLRQTVGVALWTHGVSDLPARESLLAALSDRDPGVRATAAKVLGRYAPSEPRIRDALIAALSDPDGVVQVEAHRALHMRAGKGPRTRDTLPDQSPATQPATLAPHIRDAVRAAVSEADPAMSPATAEALEHLLEALADLAGSYRWIRNCFNQPAFGSWLAVFRTLAGLAPCEPQARDAVWATLNHTDPQLRTAVLDALVPLAHTDPLRATELSRLLDHRDWRTRLHLLPFVTDEAALSACTHNLRCYESDEAQAAALAALSLRYADDPSVRAALRAAFSDERPAIRRTAAEALGPLAAADPLIRAALLAALSDSSDEVGAAAAQGLAALARSDLPVRQALLAALDSTEWKVQEAIFAGLVWLAPSEPRFRKTLFDRGSEDVCELALERLIEQAPADPLIRDDLLAALSAPSEYRRELVARSLGKLAAADLRTRDALLTTLSDRFGGVRSAALEALGELAGSDPHIRDVLLTILSEHPPMRREAIRALAGLAASDPDIQERLRTIVNQDGYGRTEAAKALRGRAAFDTLVRDALYVTLGEDDMYRRQEALEVLVEWAAADPHIRQDLCAALYDIAASSAAPSAAPEQRAPSDPVLRADLQALLSGGDLEELGATIRTLSRLAASEPLARQALYSAFSDSRIWVRLTVVEALGGPAASDPHIRAALLAALDDQDNDLRRAASRALGGLVASDPQVQNALRAALDDQDWGVRQAAARVLAPLIPSDPALYARLLDVVADEVQYSEDDRPLLPPVYGQVVRGDPQRRAEVIAMLGEADSHRRLRAAIILREAGPEAVREATPQLLAALADDRGDDSWPTRIAAAERLLSTERYGDAALDLLREALACDVGALFPRWISVKIHTQAALALSKLEAPHHRADAAARIARLLETERWPEALDGLYTALVALAAND